MDDSNAKTQVTTILTQFGWDTEDMGSAEAARAIEPLCMLGAFLVSELINGRMRLSWPLPFAR